MRKFGFVAILLTLLFGLSAPSHADPLTGHGGTPEASVSDNTGFSEAALGQLMALQRELNDAISAAFHDVEETGSHRALALILVLAFLYGVLHAIGPGHGKSVVASYFVGRHARWASGVVMGGLISVIQGVTAIILVGILAVILQWRQFDVLSHATLVEFISYGLIAALGIAMLYRALTGTGHHHDHGPALHVPGHNHDHGHADHHGVEQPLDRRLILATGLTPCASAIIILLFALANEALGIGIAAVAALSIGMAITVSSIGVATVLGRRAMLALVDRVGVQTHRIEQGLSVLGAVVIIAASGLEMVGAWYRL